MGRGPDCDVRITDCGLIGLSSASRPHARLAVTDNPQTEHHIPKLTRIATYLSFVRFSHSVFALPFALTGALLAAGRHQVGWWQVLWIVVAMVAARSAAMGFNRLVDAEFDAHNPRTAMREIPRGLVTRPAATAFVILASTLFVAAAGALGRVCLVLSPVALAIVFWYSLAKRYTSYTQAFLGLAMAVAPVGGWLAAGGRGGAEPWLLALAIGLWVAGFDVLYACQDVEFDLAHDLRSIPTRFGVPRALAISRALHVGTVIAMALVGRAAGLGPIYYGGVAVVALLLVFEQSLVSPTDLSQVKRAFDLNGYVGFLYLAATAAALYIG
jgi:4-hydroxybenzoate polyprenyltransferase